MARWSRASSSSRIRTGTASRFCNGPAASAELTTTGGNMREVDRRTQFSRRNLLRVGAAAVPVAAAVGTRIGPDAAWAAEAQAIRPHTMATLVRVARDTYPHDHIGDVFYVKAVTPWDAK